MDFHLPGGFVHLPDDRRMLPCYCLLVFGFIKPATALSPCSAISLECVTLFPLLERLRLSWISLILSILIYLNLIASYSNCTFIVTDGFGLSLKLRGIIAYSCTHCIHT